MELAEGPEQPEHDSVTLTKRRRRARASPGSTNVFVSICLYFLTVFNIQGD